ncbi:hypothetical protein Nepgr_022331 [Nepenthes gracilis]|uniref:Uncharacterized protein n=1 Tax=Nepenthes gracilis TaxID=150966 RepID=A0AAD3XY33_NEPGR|nr:hypothetical protein Nepgr_022331 [Nepenthes gracilis]
MGVFWSAISTSPAHKTFSRTSMQPDDVKVAGVAAGKRDYNMIPIILDTSAASNGKEKPNAAAKMEPYGTDGKSIVGVDKSILGQDGSNDKFSEYINRARSRFQAAPSFVENGMAASPTTEAEAEQRSLK